MSNGSPEYFQGKTEANIEGIFQSLTHIETRLEQIEKQLSALTYWKAKVIGISIGISFVVSSLIRFVKL